MVLFESPKIKIHKNSIPLIYLDTNIMIELSKYEKGCYKGCYELEIRKLYNLLASKMKKNEIICPLGYQMEEMGKTKNRNAARKFLYSYTNAELIDPFIIEKKQADTGFYAFITNSNIISFDTREIIKTNSNYSIKVNVSEIYSETKTKRLKSEKEKLSYDLNDLKKINTKYDFASQLEVELKADFSVFLYNLEHYNDSIETFSRNIDSLIEVYRRTGLNCCATKEECINAVNMHNHFLLSSFHHNLPFKWIRSVLWAHMMKRQKSIIESDHGDIIWASAYLPFVDYAITDDSFCTLLNDSGLAKLYNTKIYSMKTLEILIEAIENSTAQ